MLCSPKKNRRLIEAAIRCCVFLLLCVSKGEGHECGLQFQTRSFNNATRRIVGGRTCSVCRWPWQVALIAQGKQVCGGSLVTPSWIVTAAHCFDTEVNPTHWSVIVGEDELAVSGSLKRSEEIFKIVIHPDYRSNAPSFEYPADYDVAMVRLKRCLPLQRTTYPICLLPSGIEILPATECYVTGWGRLLTNGPHPTTLSEAKVPLVSKELCNSETIYNGIIHERAICAGPAEGGVGPCQFDSGGPLACKEEGLWYLTGVVSWGVGCGEPNKYGVYSDMSVLSDWVKDVLLTDREYAR